MRALETSAEFRQRGSVIRGARRQGGNAAGSLPRFAGAHDGAGRWAEGQFDGGQRESAPPERPAATAGGRVITVGRPDEGRSWHSQSGESPTEPVSGLI
jgi:hypothetical protein